MRTTRILIFFLGLTSLLSAQKEDYNWIFGSINVVDYSSDFNTWEDQAIPTHFTFNTDPPSFFQDTRITLDMKLTNAHYSDAEGELLLYSNGMSIHGGNHKPIMGGDTIAFGRIWADLTSENELGEREPDGFTIHNGAVFFKDPGSEEIYLFYTNGDNQDEINFESRRNKWFAKIQIDDSGFATVLEKDKVIINDIHTSGFVKCAQHANGRDWWFLQHRSDTIFSFLIDPSGVNLHHTQRIPFKMQVHKGGGSAYDPRAEQLALFQFSIDDLGSELVIMDFDRSTGMVSNERIQYRQDSLAFFTNGLEYSPSGRYLYLANLHNIFQFDTWADDIFATEQVVMEWDESVSLSPGLDDPRFGRPNTFNMMQRGPDNKIYISGGTQGNYLHIIHKPNEEGRACEVEPTAIHFTTHYFTTMPNFNTLRLGPIDGSISDTLGLDNNPVSRFRYEQDTLDFKDISFVDLSYFEPTRWEWDFGDGTSSIEPSPFHAYDEDGIYEVCLTVSNENSSNISCDTLFLGVTSLDNQTEDRHISLFPNPVETVTRVAIHDYLPQSAVMRIYNQSGQLVQTATLTGVTTTVDMSALTSGVYVYEVWDGKKRLSGGKVVKM